MTHFESTHLEDLPRPGCWDKMCLCCDLHVMLEYAVRGSVKVSE